jgi:hypothetical protein
MAWRREEGQPVSCAAAFDNLTVDHLKPLAKLVTNEVPTRKTELVALLARHLTNLPNVRALYQRLDPLAQHAVREAAHQAEGELQQDRFVARHGQIPSFHKPSEKKQNPWSSYDYDSYKRPTLLLLFLPQQQRLPADLQKLLLTFVPPPEEFALATLEQLPATIPQTHTTWEDGPSGEVTEQVPLQVRETARAAEQELRAVLRLIEAGRVKVTDKKLQPTPASRQALAEVLVGGDFYTADDQADWEGDPAGDLTIKPFAWPILAQAGGLAEKSGAALKLTAAGRKALAQPAAQTLRAIYPKWRSSKVLDEFGRIEAIKGQAKGQLSALADRRKAVLDGLASCPVGAWFKVDDFFRFLVATDRDFVLARNPFGLYIAEHYYGHLGQGGDLWEMLQGRYILVVLFEYVATLGWIDVAYVPPQGQRTDFGGLWGTDDMSCLSRYDGLLYVRINPLGAWCLGLAERYEMPAAPIVEVLRVLPNLEVVVTKLPVTAADRLLLDRFAEQQSEAAWRLTAAKMLDVLEQGGTLDELVEFLRTHGAAELPPTVQVFLDDLRQRAGQLRDLGTTRLVECADATVARMLAVDPQLGGRCQLAGERCLVFRASEETAVRKALRRLGYILPPGRE